MTNTETCDVDATVAQIQRCADAGADIGAGSAQLGLRITRIGRIVAGEGVHPVDAKSQPWSSPRRGYDHFAEH